MNQPMFLIFQLTLIGAIVLANLIGSNWGGGKFIPHGRSMISDRGSTDFDAVSIILIRIIYRNKERQTGSRHISVA